MLATLIYFMALATAAVAQEPWLHLQYNPDPLAPYTDSSNFWFVSYIIGKFPKTFVNGDKVSLQRGKAIYMSSSFRFTPGKSGHLQATANRPEGDFCLDAGALDPVNGAVVQLWQCIDNHPPQEWIVENGQVKLAGTNFCLDFPLGTATGIGDLHIWECTCNKNQAFRVRCGLYPGQDPNCTDK